MTEIVWVREMKVAVDNCPFCNNQVEVFVPEPWALAPEMLNLLEIVQHQIPHTMKEDCGRVPHPLYERIIKVIQQAKGAAHV